MQMLDNRLTARLISANTFLLVHFCFFQVYWSWLLNFTVSLHNVNLNLILSTTLWRMTDNNISKVMILDYFP